MDNTFDVTLRIAVYRHFAAMREVTRHGSNRSSPLKRCDRIQIAAVSQEERP